MGLLDDIFLHLGEVMLLNIHKCEKQTFSHYATTALQTTRYTIHKSMTTVAEKQTKNNKVSKKQ